MARIGGRSLWLAWPVGVLCAGVVGALVWLSRCSLRSCSRRTQAAAWLACSRQRPIAAAMARAKRRASDAMPRTPRDPAKRR